MGVSLLAPQDLEVPGLVDGGLHLKVGPLFVVELDMIAAHPMLDPDAFGPLPQTADNFAGKGRREV